MNPKPLMTMILSIIIFSNSYSQAQYSSIENNTEKMIKEFYSKYCKIWESTSSSLPANLLKQKIDSLVDKYCSSKIKKEASEWYEDGHDLFTNDWGIDFESLKSLSVMKDLTKSNTFIVSYVAKTYPVSPDKAVSRKVILYVSVIKWKDSYKINEVK